ncbi:MAG: signal peptidase II [Planctomycetes bacterium]|nr:signal peptidase II [Planctomycetota bacterium]
MERSQESSQLSPLQRAFTRKGVFWVVTLAALVADIASKAWADTVIRPTAPKVTPLIDGFLGWKWAENQGAAFSILDGKPVVLATIGLCILTALFIYMYRADPKGRWLLTGLAFVVSGAVGNLYDRLLLGHVRDFMFFIFDLPFHGTKILGFEIPLKYPVFNVADMAIIAGVLMLVIHSFRTDAKKKAAKKAEEAAEKKAEENASKDAAAETQSELTSSRPEPATEATHGA